MNPTGTWIKCHRCKSDMWIPAALDEAAQAAKEVITFYCAYGHSQHYIKGESQETILRRERDRLKQREAQLMDAVNDEKRRREIAESSFVKAETSRTLAQKKLVKLKARAATGTCPCCNRNFSELQKHIATKHPTFRAEDITRENIVSIVKTKSA
jgi:hypothetical protein